MATLYRKYRSARFEDVIGQDPIVTTLTNQIKLGRIGHAYLFTGSRGVGKTSCARIFARAVNCLHPVNGSPCGECEVCKKLAVDNVDIVEMDAASNNGVDDARDIREKVKYLPVACKYKVYIIDEVHMLTGGAFNALLKTIEEPPDHVIFILATTEPQKLPQTILSRCIRFDFRLVPTDILAKHIARIYDAEGIKYTEGAVEEIARLGEGSVRDALSVADTLASAAETVTEEVVLSLTGAGDSSAIAELFDKTAKRDLNGVLLSVDKLVSSGKSMAAVVRQLIDYTRNVLVAKSVGAKAFSTMINADKAQQSAILSAASYDMNDIARILEGMSAAENGLKYSVNPRVFTETALIKLVCGMEREDDILRRLTNLEKNSAAPAAEQKKNINKADDAQPVKEPHRTSPQPEEKKTPIKAKNVPSATENPKEQTKKAVEPQKKQPESGAPDEYVPPPTDDFAPPIEREPTRDDARSSAARSAPSRESSTPVREKKSGAEKISVSAADEGEFRHLSAESERGLELMGKIVRALRKSSDPSSARVMRLLGRATQIVERDDYIAVVAGDDVFLQLGDVSVKGVIADVLNSLGIKKRPRIEKTAGDMFREDVNKAKILFGRDGVVIP